jgi:glycosyltransferase involved in cell wall biosynthesis
VSVLMAVHNGERHLPPAIESILGQTFDDLELVVVDDASTDRSRAIVESYDDARVRVLVNTENLGLTRSLNRGLAETRGRYVARQDADDLSARNRLALQIGHLEQHPEVALIASAYRRIDDDGRDQGSRAAPLATLDVRWRLLFLNAFAHSSIVFRRSSVVELGGYDEAVLYAQDYDLWSRIAERHEVAALPEELVSYRRSAASMTSALRDASGPDEMAAISRRNVDRVLPGMGARLDRDTAWRLLFANPRTVRVSAAATCVRDVLALQSAFARHYSLDRRAALAHRASVLAALARGLARAGAGALAGFRR